MARFPEWNVFWRGLAADRIQPGQGRLNIDAVEVFVDPRAEWLQIFNEAWRINRDYFYASNMHGADWNAMKQKYAVFLPDLAVRADLNRVIDGLETTHGLRGLSASPAVVRTLSSLARRAQWHLTAFVRGRVSGHRHLRCAGLSGDRRRPARDPGRKPGAGLLT